jgi:hypothetical protein
MQYCDFEEHDRAEQLNYYSKSVDILAVTVMCLLHV